MKIKKIYTRPQQTVLDILLQEYGSIDAWFELLQLNPELNLNSNLPVSWELNVSDNYTHKRIADYFRLNPAATLPGKEWLLTDFNNDFNCDFAGAVKCPQFTGGGRL